MTRLPRRGSPLALPVLYLLTVACAGSTPIPEGASEPPVSVDRIRDKPDAFIGQRVRIAAAVAEPHGNRVFVLKDDDPAFKEQLLVMTTRPLPRLLAEERTTLKAGEKLLVSGVVRGGDLMELERELGVDLDPRLEDRFRGKPVLVASEVIRTDDRDQEVPDTAAGY